MQTMKPDKFIIILSWMAFVTLIELINLLNGQCLDVVWYIINFGEFTLHQPLLIFITGLHAGVGIYFYRDEILGGIKDQHLNKRYPKYLLTAHWCYLCVLMPMLIFLPTVAGLLENLTGYHAAAWVPALWRFNGEVLIPAFILVTGIETLNQLVVRCFSWNRPA